MAALAATGTATYLDGSLKLEEDGLRDENLSSFCAEKANLGLEQLNLLSRAASTHFQQAINDGIEVYLILVCHLPR